MISIIAVALIFLTGTVFGSFYNVLIDRLPFGKNIVTKRSRCDNCHRQIAWYDLIPVLSFILLNGKCRLCAKKLSFYYPVIELLTGILFVVVIFASYQTVASIHFVFYQLIVYSGLFIIFFTDLKYRLIPDEIMAILILSAFFYLVLFNISSFGQNILGAVAFCAFFLFLIIITKGKGMGLGDAKLAFFIGLYLGIIKTLIAFYVSFLTGAGFAVVAMLLKKKTLKSTLPFGPFLIFGIIASQIYSSQILTLLDKLWNY